MSDPLISVIVPVYNVEKYLRKCLDSIINQTYKNLEIILINDGSTDLCPQICDEYSAKDTRIKIIHQKNKGISATRNVGIELARGGYLAFIDSDDYVKKDFIECLYKRIVQDKSDFVMCNFETVDENANKLNEYKKIREDEKSLLTFSDFWQSFEKHQAVNIVVWNKLYKKEIFSDIRFLEGHKHEDVFVMPFIMDKVNSISLEKKVLYNYLRRSDSITGNNTKSKNFNADEFAANAALAKHFFKHKLFNLATKKIINIVTDSTKNYKKSQKSKDDKKGFKSVCKELKALYKNNKKEFLNEGLKFKIFMTLFCLSPSLLYLLRKLLKLIKG